MSYYDVAGANGGGNTGEVHRTAALVGKVYGVSMLVRQLNWIAMLVTYMSRHFYKIIRGLIGYKSDQKWDIPFHLLYHLKGQP